MITLATKSRVIAFSTLDTPNPEVLEMAECDTALVPHWVNKFQSDYSSSIKMILVEQVV